MAKRKTKSAEKEPQKVVNTQQHVAEALGVSLKTVQGWRLRGMPGGQGNYDLDSIMQWHRDTIRRGSLDPEEQEEKFADANLAKARLLVAQADRERALANMAARQDDLEQGSYVSLDSLNLFMGEFFTEFRQILNRAIVNFTAGYGPELRLELKPNLQQQVDLALEQMRDWMLRTQDLEIVATKKR